MGFSDNREVSYHELLIHSLIYGLKTDKRHLGKTVREREEAMLIH